MPDRTALDRAATEWYRDSRQAGVPLPVRAYLPSWLQDHDRWDVERSLIALWVAREARRDGPIFRGAEKIPRAPIGTGDGE